MNMFKVIDNILLNYFTVSLCQYRFPLTESESVNFISFSAGKSGHSGSVDQRKSHLAAAGGRMGGRDAGAIQQCRGAMTRY